ncbi:protein kinase [Coemansia sp. RSA 1813]|nr:protein kinase [Coemansia sp. RSA 1843]KAJ2085702.1 protein kinase [Coemansia sp. RSA 986]KAJ2214393.1 protein kinase [Coemansia sp. RSA 487]KAJ2563240.1 protein kinase [Coemansia sp. RSA 1813]
MSQDSKETSSDSLEMLRVSSHLQSQNAQFQAEIAAQDPTETDDPLDVYYRYIQWLLEVFPQANGHQSVIRLVERPLKLFQEEERYRNDTRFVKMWLWYIGIVNSSQEAVFQFLMSNKIGDSLAIMYEEYAKMLESYGKTRKADEAYQLGIARRAQPLARLQRKYSDFQRRLMAHTVRDIDSQQQRNDDEDDGRISRDRSSSTNNENHSSPLQRTILGTKRSGRSTKSVAANALPASQRGSISSTASASTSRPNARIAVYSDDPHSNGENSNHTEPAMPWLDIGSDEGRRKENIPEAASWRGQKLAQRRVLTSTGRIATVAPHGTPIIEKFTVFQDSDDDGSGFKSADDYRTSSLSSAHDTKSKSKTKDKGKPKEKAVEKMVMPLEMLFPAGDDVPQCVEEARAKLPKYTFDYEQWTEQQRQAASQERQGGTRYIDTSLTIDSDDEDNGIADESGYGRHSKRKSVAVSSPTINTRVAQKDMLGIWNDASDSDSDGSLLDVNRCSNSASSRGKATADGRGRPTSVSDDDYQFTMGPVTPNVVPKGMSALPPMIPSSARPGNRFESFLDGSGVQKDENDPPTVALSSIRAARRQQQQLHSGLKPTPLATRAHTPLVSSVLRSSDNVCAPGNGLRDIDEEEEESEDDNCGDAVSRSRAAQAESLMRTLDSQKTPMAGHSRIEVFRDHPKGSAERPGPLFSSNAGSRAEKGRNAAEIGSLDTDYPPIPPPASVRKASSSMYYSTPGYSRTATGFSVSGAELTGVSGFTGISTIGGQTASLLIPGGSTGRQYEEYGIEEEDDEEEDDDDVASAEHSGYRRFSGASVQTPMRKRLSMAAKDLGKITPRFPKNPTDEQDLYGGYSRNAASELEDEDEDDEDVDDDDEDPCTENMGEFGNLDSQMNELQMELGANFSSQQSSATPGKPSASTPMFSVFRD